MFVTTDTFIMLVDSYYYENEYRTLVKFIILPYRIIW